MGYSNNSADWESAAILTAYNEIKISIPSLKADSLNVVKAVIKHRNYWKPPQVKTLLLAESHVYTSDEEHSNRLQYPNYEDFGGLPQEFVKLVYCLGYGEQTLVPSVSDNAGTWQYWKIFTACASDSPEIDFHTYLKGGCQSIDQRLLNKLNLLKKLVYKGIWLVDSSIVALYRNGPKPKIEIRQKAISISWQNYISQLIEIACPKRVALIGNSVTETLKLKLDAMGIPFEKLPQPQKRMSADEIKETHLKYQRICNRE